MERSKRARLSWAGGVAAAVLLLAAPARADFDFQLSATAGGGWLRERPMLTADSLSTSLREFPRQDLRPRGGIAMAAVGMDAELVLDDRYRVLLFGGNLSWAVGSYDTTITSYDGSIARLRPWTALRGDILLPGIGQRWKHRRYMFGAAIRGGVTVYSEEGTVVTGRDSHDLELSAGGLLVQLELEACKRLDPTTRACLTVVPRVYEHQILNGFLAGIRMEWGR